MNIKDVVEKLSKNNGHLSTTEFASDVFDTLRKNKVNYGKENILSIFMDPNKTVENIKRDIASYRAADVLGLADDEYEKDEGYVEKAKNANENPFYFYSALQKLPLNIEGIYDDFGRLYKDKNLIPDFNYDNRELTIQKGNPKLGNGKTARSNVNDTEFAILLIYEKIDQLIDDKIIELDKKSNVAVKKALATLIVVGAYCDKHGIDGFDQILDYYSPVIEGSLSLKEKGKETAYEIISEANDIANFYAMNVDNVENIIDRKFFENNLYDLKLNKELETRVSQTSDANINVSGHSKSGKNIKFINSDGILENINVAVSNNNSVESLAGQIFGLDKTLFKGIQDKNEQVRQILLMNAMMVAYQPIEEEDKKKLFQAYMIPYIQLPGSDIVNDSKNCIKILVENNVIKGLPMPSIDAEINNPVATLPSQNNVEMTKPQISVKAVIKNAVVEEKKMLKWMRKELVKICLQKIKGSYNRAGQSLAGIAERKATLGYLLKNEGKVKGKKTLQEAKFDDATIDLYNSVENYIASTIEDLLKKYPNGSDVPEDEMKKIKKEIKAKSQKVIEEKVKS